MNPIFSIQPISNNFGLSLFFSSEFGEELEGFDSAVDIYRLNMLLGFIFISIGLIKHNS